MGWMSTMTRVESGCDRDGDENGTGNEGKYEKERTAYDELREAK